MVANGGDRESPTGQRRRVRVETAHRDRRPDLDRAKPSRGRVQGDGDLERALARDQRMHDARRVPDVAHGEVLRARRDLHEHVPTFGVRGGDSAQIGEHDLRPGDRRAGLLVTDGARDDGLRRLQERRGQIGERRENCHAGSEVTRPSTFANGPGPTRAPGPRRHGPVADATRSMARLLPPGPPSLFQVSTTCGVMSRSGPSGRHVRWRFAAPSCSRPVAAPITRRFLRASRSRPTGGSRS